MINTIKLRIRYYCNVQGLTACEYKSERVSDKKRYAQLKIYAAQAFEITELASKYAYCLFNKSKGGGNCSACKEIIK